MVSERPLEGRCSLVAIVILINIINECMTYGYERRWASVNKLASGIDSGLKPSEADETLLCAFG